MSPRLDQPFRIAVVGGGISGLAAAWLLATRHDVVLYEREARLGGHSNTVDVETADGVIPVDTGFIVYNPGSYPNLIALFEHLGVPTARSNMSFSVSLDGGRIEYSGSGLHGLFGQPARLFDRDHWAMIRDTLRFFRDAETLARSGADDGSLRTWLSSRSYSRPFIERHIAPMAAAIWSTPAEAALDYPVAAFARFFANHGLLQVRNRPQWRTVLGGSREYVARIAADFAGEMRTSAPVTRVERNDRGVDIVSGSGHRDRFDHVVLACHADETLALLADADREERALLSSCRYAPNEAVLHTDARAMPQRQRLWSSWNYLAAGATGSSGQPPVVSYWMNRLQPLPTRQNLFVTLNPAGRVADSHVLARFLYAHPQYDVQTLAAQRRLWELQGRRRTWFAGAYFGAGFHEDGLQAGLAVAEDLGGVRRPWRVADDSARIVRTSRPVTDALLDAAE
jgi:predicted NAD/FAD-binding protein